MTVHVSIPIDEADKADLEAWARARGVSVDAMLAKAVDAFVAEQREIADAIARGREAAARNDLIDHADVVAEFETRRADWRRRA